MKELLFIIYLSILMLLGKQDRAYSIALNHYAKQKQKNIGMLHFLLHYTVYSLYFFWTTILTTQVNNLCYDFSGTIKKDFSIIVYTFLSLLFSIQNLLSRCGDNEENPGT